MKLYPEYIIMAILTIVLVVLLVLQSCRQQPDVSDSYGINIKVTMPAEAYVLEAGK